MFYLQKSQRVMSATMSRSSQLFALVMMLFYKYSPKNANNV